MTPPATAPRRPARAGEDDRTGRNPRPVTANAPEVEAKIEAGAGDTLDGAGRRPTPLTDPGTTSPEPLPMRGAVYERRHPQETSPYSDNSHTAYASASPFRSSAVSLMLDVLSQDEW